VPSSGHLRRLTLLAERDLRRPGLSEVAADWRQLAVPRGIMQLSVASGQVVDTRYSVQTNQGTLA